MSGQLYVSYVGQRLRVTQIKGRSIVHHIVFVKRVEANEAGIVFTGRTRQGDDITFTAEEAGL